LLSVSVLNVLRAQSLPGTDFGDPAAVLTQLNRVFPMEQQNNLLFTAWYGVLDRRTRQLAFGSGGHPPAILVEGSAGTSAEVRRLSTGGRVLGCDPVAAFCAETCEVKPGSRIYVFSDGAYEITGPSGCTLQLADLTEQLRQPAVSGRNKLDELLAWAKGFGGDAPLEDDLSLLEIEV
jgi:sigma-B regulation protein RsbU (phosphoserine phosphatase)